MLKKENVELDGSIFEALELFFRYRDKNIIESLATAFEKVSEKLLHQHDGVQVDGSLLLKYFSLIRSLIESNVDICLKVAKSLHTLTDLFSVDISDCAKVVINDLLQCLSALQKFVRSSASGPGAGAGGGGGNAGGGGLPVPPPQLAPQPSKLTFPTDPGVLSPTGALQTPLSRDGSKSVRQLEGPPGTEEEEGSLFEYARAVTTETGGMPGEELKELLGSIEIFDSEGGAIFMIHNHLVRIFINLMIKESGSLLITYEEGIEFTKTLIVKSTLEFPDYMKEEIRRLVNARIKSFRFQEIFLDAGFYKYVKELFSVKNEDLLRALIKIYEILITLNFEANQELVNSILAELAEILKFSTKHEVIAQIIAIFISSSPQSLSFVSLEQLAALYQQMAHTPNLSLLLEVTKLIVISFRDTPGLSIRKHQPLVAQIVNTLIQRLGETSPPACKLGEDPSAGSSSDLMAMHGSSQGLQQVFESKDQRNKLIHVLLSYAKEIAGENLASDLLEAGDNLRAIAEAVVAEPRNEEFLMQLLRISVAACGSLSGEVSEEQSGLQHYISQLVFELCDEIIGVVQKSSENYYCKVLANDLFNLTMLMHLPCSEQTQRFFLKLTKLVKHPLDEIVTNTISFFGSYFVIHVDTPGLVAMFQTLGVVSMLAGLVAETKLAKSILGPDARRECLLLELFCSLQKLFKDAELLGGFPRKEALIHKTTELLGGTANVALLESIAQTLLVMLANPDCEALFLAQPHSLATLIDLLPRYAANPSLYGGLTLSILRIFERTSANPVNHGVLLEAESLSHLHALISTAAGGIALPDIELALAQILNNVCRFTGAATVLASLEQNSLLTLELLLFQGQPDYKKGVLVLSTLFFMLETQREAVAPRLAHLTNPLIELSQNSKYFKHRKVAEAILAELGLDVSAFSQNQEHHILQIFHQFGIATGAGAAAGGSL